jgi:hypothetical protein
MEVLNFTVRSVEEDCRQSVPIVRALHVQRPSCRVNLVPLFVTFAVGRVQNQGLPCSPRPARLLPR